jgi:hypothetical protein
MSAKRSTFVESRLADTFSPVAGPDLLPPCRNSAYDRLQNSLELFYHASSALGVLRNTQGALLKQNGLNMASLTGPIERDRSITRLRDSDSSALLLEIRPDPNRMLQLRLLWLGAIAVPTMAAVAVGMFAGTYVAAMTFGAVGVLFLPVGLVLGIPPWALWRPRCIRATDTGLEIVNSEMLPSVGWEQIRGSTKIGHYSWLLVLQNGIQETFETAGYCNRDIKLLNRTIGNCIERSRSFPAPCAEAQSAQPDNHSGQLQV